jgi:hypothetical protein
MRCPSCGTETGEETGKCTACGVHLPSKVNRRTRARPDPANPQENLLAWRAFHCSQFSMIPVAGLILGPLSVSMAVWARRGSRSDSGNKSLGPSAAAIFLGLGTTLTQWLGLYLILRGWNSW